jgi:hypothetical protein
MEKAQRESRDRDDGTEVADATRTTGRGSGGGDGGAPVRSAAGATQDTGWEADVSVLAAMGIMIGRPKPGTHPDAGHGAGGDGGKAKPHTLPGVATPPKGEPQGRVTEDNKKELQNKREAKAGGAAKAPGDAGAQNTPGTPGAQAAEGTQAGQMGSGAPGAPKPPGSGSGDLDATDAHNVERLIALLDTDADPVHRRAAAHALGKLRSPKARAALEKAAHDKDPSVAKAAAASLATL